MPPLQALGDHSLGRLKVELSCPQKPTMYVCNCIKRKLHSQLNSVGIIIIFFKRTIIEKENKNKIT
jgi:hypothetical protein